MTALMFLQHVFVSTLILTVLSAVVFLFCWFLSPNSSRICRTLWFFVLLSGLFWFRISLPLPLLPPQQPAETVSIETPVTPSVARSFEELAPVVPQTGEVAATKISGETLIFAIWLGGVLVFLGRGIVGYVRLLRNLSLATPERSPVWESLLTEANIAPGKIPVVLSEDIGPLLVRLPFRHLLVLPEEPWENLSDEAKRGILRHELEHYRRGDILKSFGVWLLSLVHWFNPCAWLARIRFDDAAEWACDEAAHGYTETGIASYAKALIAIHESNRLQQAAHRAILGRAIQGKSFSERIHRLIHFRKEEDSMFKKTCLITFLVLCMTMAVVRVHLVAAPAPEGGTPTDAQQLLQKNINNLQQLVLGLHTYYDAHGKLPSVYTVDKTGKPMHSWRVALLPYLGNLELYEKIRQDEPWDSEFNRQFHNQMPKVYRFNMGSDESAKNGFTHYAVVVGDVSAKNPDGLPGEPVFMGANHRTFKSITDGTSNTVAVVLRAKPVCWMDPNSDIPFEIACEGIDVNIDGIGALRTLGDSHNICSPMALCDGSVILVSKKIPKDILRAMITCNGGESGSIREYLVDQSTVFQGK